MTDEERLMTPLCPVCGMALMGGRCVFPMCATHTKSVSAIGTLQIVGQGQVYYLRSDRIESVMYNSETRRTHLRTFSGDEFQVEGDQANVLAVKLGWTPATTGGLTKV